MTSYFFIYFFATAEIPHFVSYPDRIHPFTPKPDQLNWTLFEKGLTAESGFT